MKIRFEPISPISRWLYVIGFSSLAINSIFYWQFPGVIPDIYWQQWLIASVIVIACGSMINLAFQIRRQWRKKEP